MFLNRWHPFECVDFYTFIFVFNADEYNVMVDVCKPVIC